MQEENQSPEILGSSPSQISIGQDQQSLKLNTSIGETGLNNTQDDIDPEAANEDADEEDPFNGVT